MIVKRVTSTALALSLCLCGVVAPARAQEQEKAPGVGEIEYGKLEEIRGKRIFMLLVSRSLTVDARAPAKISAADVRGALENPRGHPESRAHYVIAGRLNKYIRKYKSMDAFETRDSPEVFIVFKITRERPNFTIDNSFSYGKMFVFTFGDGEKAKPRVVWESDEMTMAEDAADEFIKALKAVRGEK
jgi:hypothetical protein